MQNISYPARACGGYNFASHVSDSIYWDDAYPIALILRRARPDENPLDVPLERLRDWVVQLDGFADDRDTLPMDCLEQIQLEWVELGLGPFADTTVQNRRPTDRKGPKDDESGDLQGAE